MVVSNLNHHLSQYVAMRIRVRLCLCYVQLRITSVHGAVDGLNVNPLKLAGSVRLLHCNWNCACHAARMSPFAESGRVQPRTSRRLPAPIIFVS